MAYDTQRYDTAVVDILTTLRRKTDRLWEQVGRNRIDTQTFDDFRTCASTLGQTYFLEADLAAIAYADEAPEIDLVIAAASGANLQAAQLLLEVLQAVRMVHGHSPENAPEVYRNALGRVTAAIIELELHLGVH